MLIIQLKSIKNNDDEEQKQTAKGAAATASKCITKTKHHTDTARETAAMGAERPEEESTKTTEYWNTIEEKASEHTLLELRGKRTPLQGMSQ